MLNQGFTIGDYFDGNIGQRGDDQGDATDQQDDAPELLGNADVG
jgi:hypothetical protein